MGKKLVIEGEEEDMTVTHVISLRMRGDGIVVLMSDQWEVLYMRPGKPLNLCCGNLSDGAFPVGKRGFVEVERNA